MYKNIPALRMMKSEKNSKFWDDNYSKYLQMRFPRDFSDQHFKVQSSVTSVLGAINNSQNIQHISTTRYKAKQPYEWKKKYT